MNYYGSYQLLQMPKTLKVVSACWGLAEGDMQKEIQQYIPNADEEFITRFFHGKFAEWLSAASAKRMIERAFLNDLVTSFPTIDTDKLSQIANGLVADVRLHNRSSETVTGGDLGLILIRPQLTYSGDYISIGDYRRGILCQAKLKDVTGSWGRFTRNQRKVLPERLPYSCLLLYHYTDAERRQLHNFQWYICKAEDTMAQLSAYLRNDSFPLGDLVESKLIIKAVGYGRIGTDNEEIIDRLISRTKNPTLIISITWPPGGHPGSDVCVYATDHQQMNIQMRQGYL